MKPVSVPFMPTVAIKAIEILTESAYAQADYNLTFEVLCRRIPDQHPMLISEHLDYATELIEASKRFAKQVKAGELSQADALAHLETTFDAFEIESVTRALAFALQA
jgi:hypothetical protein